MYLVHKISAAALAVFLLATSLKSRLLLDEIIVYFIPFGIFAFATIAACFMSVHRIVPRINAAAIFIVLFAGPLYAFFISDGSQIDLFSIIALNTAVGMLVVLYPWNEESLNSLLQFLAIIAAIISIHTMLFFGSDELIVERAGEDFDTGDYLTVTFAMGIGVICSTYLLVKSFSPLYIALFGLNWLGVALGRGRGAFLFCVVVAILYLIVAMSSRISSFSRVKKTVMFMMILGFVPIIFAQVLKMSRMREGIGRILFSPDHDNSLDARGTAFSEGLQAFYQAPLFGNGLGVYGENSYGHPHNLVLSWAIDGGLIGLGLLTLFFLAILFLFARSVKLSDSTNINIVFVMGALCLYMLLNFMKSHDPYITRELYIMAALPIAAYLAVGEASRLRRRRFRRRRRRSRTKKEARDELSGDLGLSTQQ